MNASLALIVEDDEELAEIFDVLLSGIGFQTSIARDGRDALALLQSQTPLLVLLDLNLPFVSGVEVLSYIRADERLSTTKVAVITANHYMAGEVQDRADIVLMKPIGFQDTRDLIARFMK